MYATRLRSRFRLRTSTYPTGRRSGSRGEIVRLCNEGNSATTLSRWGRRALVIEQCRTESDACAQGAPQGKRVGLYERKTAEPMLTQHARCISDGARSGS